MQLKEIIEQLEQFCPPSLAESWDNPGLQCGRTDEDVSTVYLALDATSDVIEDAIRRKADLIVTHHPLLFHAISHVTDTDFTGKRIVRMLQADIGCYAMHTNFDVLGMADAAADALKLTNRDVLEVTYEDSISHEGIGRIGELPEHMTLQECASYVADVFSIPHVRVYGDPEQAIVTAAVLPGSGSGDIDLAVQKGADVMITGDISHHNGIDAVEKGISIIDAGHYGVEKLFIPYMKDYFHREMPELVIVCAPVKEPFFEI